ncbi:MAG: GlsB/YeaQ/YmgE family stress response membrane protein, partial [Nocardioides sp.]|uniref:GlsB/YeaQ/YmgE family stress response membrane protein n=1 Tax=Nocardioides sp. TaxID=35761 RepID=UPI0032631267
MLGLILTIIIVGAIAGFVARLLVPGRQDLSIVATIVLGIVGSLIGGLLGYEDAIAVRIEHVRDPDDHDVVVVHEGDKDGTTVTAHGLETNPLR